MAVECHYLCALVFGLPNLSGGKGGADDDARRAPKPPLLPPTNRVVGGWIGSHFQRP